MSEDIMQVILTRPLKLSPGVALGLSPSGAVWALLDTENGEKERVAVQKAAIGRK